MKPLLLTFLMSVSMIVHGQFSSHLISSTFNDGRSSVLADIDNDGDLDIVFDQGSLYVYKNLDGKGTFGDLVTITTEGGDYTTAVDVDSDGDLDLLHSKDEIIFISKNIMGDGSTWETQSIGQFSNSGQYKFVHFVDLDDDGDLDIVNNAMAWFENLDSQFTLGEERMIIALPPGQGCSRNIHPIDWDHDNDLDILVNQATDIGASQIFLFENDGKHNYTKVMLKDTIASIDGLTHSVLSDVDRDGDPDFVIHGGSNDIGWFENENGQLGDFIFIHEYYDVQGDFGLADMNGDGNLDVLWCGHPGIFYKENLGNFTFDDDVTKIGPSGIDATNDFSLGDIDGDGDVDLLALGRSIGNWPQDMRWYENNIPQLSTASDDLEKIAITAYPNPTSDKLHIKGRFEVASIYSLAGIKINETTHSTLDLSEQAPGIYMLQVTTASGTIVQSILVN